jgi:hypothetical protein
MNKTPEYTLRAIKAYKARQNQDPVKREQNKIKHREYMRQWRLKNKQSKQKMEVRRTNSQNPKDLESQSESKSE